MRNLRQQPGTGRPGIWISLFAACLSLAVNTTAQQARDAGHPQGRWEVLEGCRLVPGGSVDGDSFQVQQKGRTYSFRLYFVDAPEADPDLTERVRDQAAYFGVVAAKVPEGGAMAAQFTRARLADQEFTIVTRWQNAMGRSGLARFYAIALVRGKNLSEDLVENGLARIHGLKANWPEGNRSATTIATLKNLELKAREARRGLWNQKTFPPEVIRTATTDKGGPSDRLDLNEATYQELVKLPGIGPKLAERIIANRPYAKVDDLLKIDGIGAKNLEPLRPLVRVEGVEGEK